MDSRYQSNLKFHGVRAYRAVIRSIIGTTVSWQPMREPKDGYTIILGCVAGLAEMLLSNLACLARQDLTHLHEIIILFDRPLDRLPVDVKAIVAQRVPKLRCRFVCYTRYQRLITRLMRWPWVDL